MKQQNNLLYFHFFSNKLFNMKIASEVL